MKNHIEPGIIIVTDGWTGYTFLDKDDSVWEHEIYNHGGGIFGFETHSTSNIEHTYNIFPKDNYIYFILEVEFRLNICKITNKAKLNIFKNLLKYVYDLNQFNF